MLQGLLICKNSEECIYNTLMSWASVIDRFCILINNTTDNTELEILRTGLNCVIFHDDFIDFSTTRNKLIKLSRDPKYEYNIMLDDSYEMGSFDKSKLGGKLMSISVKCGNCVYPRAIIFDNNPLNFYTGKIHEIIRGESSIFEGLIIDRHYSSHSLRRMNREYLGDDDRSRYYRGINNRDIVLLKTIKEDTILLWYSLNALANLEPENSIKYLIKAALIIPETSPECYFKCFLLSSSMNFLKIIKNYERVPKITLCYDLYGPNGKIKKVLKYYENDLR